MRPLAFAAFALLIACDTSSPVPGAAVEIRADRAVYVTSPDLHVGVSAVNVSDRPVYYLCNGSQHVLERRGEGEWVEVGVWYGRYAYYCGPAQLEPGETVADLPPIARPADSGFTLSPGTYRVRSEFFEDGGLSIRLPPAEVTSLPFEVR